MTQLSTDATAIRNLNNLNANTPERVGEWMQDAAEVLAGSTSPFYIVVDSIGDLPTAVSGVITLEAGRTYVLTTDIDLGGHRIAAAGVVNFYGLSSETSSITSTGLSVGVPLITSEHTIVLRSLTIKDVDTALDIDGNSRTVALDWIAVNFRNVPNVGVINTCDNFIFETGALLNSSGLRFTGTVGTIGMSNSLFSGNGLASNIIEVDANAVITRRFRVIYSSFVVIGSNVGINFNASASVPIENYILDTVNFGGGGTFLSGLTYTSEKAFFVNCRGIINTTAIAGLYMLDNVTATNIAATGTLYRVLGTVTLSGFSQKFVVVTDNSSTRYVSTVPRLMRIQSSISFTSTQNNIVGFYIGVKKGGSIVPAADRVLESEVYVTASGTRPDTAFIQAIVELQQNDEVYLITQNETATNSVTVQFMHTIVERTN